MGIIAWIVFGFVVGLIARALVPGRQHMGFALTTLLGIAGSIIGGLIGSALSGRSGTAFQPAGFLGSIIGAIALLVLATVVSGARRRTI